MKRVITINSNDLEKSLYTKELLTKKLEENNFLVSSKLEENKNILVEKLLNSDFQVSEQIEKNTELIISIGGDGSFLKTIQDFKFPNVPMVVINTGHLGFFAEFDPDEIDEFIELYKNNDFTIQEVHPLKGSICTKESSKDIYAVNEIVIKSVCSRTLHLDLRVNENKIQNFSGDGMLISTPIGSTAYNYSAGGSIIDPSLDTLQLTPLAPMNTIVYRSFTSSIVLSAKSTISIVPEYRFENSILVVVDGNEYRFNDITDIHIVRSDLKLKLLRRSDFEFWKRASEKFL